MQTPLAMGLPASAQPPAQVHHGLSPEILDRCKELNHYGVRLQNQARLGSSSSARFTGCRRADGKKSCKVHKTSIWRMEASDTCCSVVFFTLMTRKTAEEESNAPL